MEISRLFARRRRQPVALGWIVRSVWPPGPRLLAAQTLLSATADAVGGRDGALVTDRMSGGGITGGFQMNLALIRPGTVPDVMRSFARRAAELGLERDPHAPLSTADAADGPYWYSGARTLPRVAFAFVRPGGALDGLPVPEGSVGVAIGVQPGFTMSAEDGRHRAKAPNPAARTHLAQLGIDIEPPPGWQRFWYWWWARLAVRCRLSWTARRLGAGRGTPLAVWLVGGELVGPYTFGVMSVQQGTYAEVADRIADRAGRRGYRVASGDAASPARSFTAAPGRPVLHLAGYGPGEAVDLNGGTVPAGSTAVIVTLTTGRKKNRART
jgi:hypothetical protein